MSDNSTWFAVARERTWHEGSGKRGDDELSTLRGAIVAVMAQVVSASNEVIVDGCFPRRVGNTTTGVVNTTDSISTFVASVGAEAVVVMMLVWRAAMSKCSVWSRQKRSSGETQPSV